MRVVQVNKAFPPPFGGVEIVVDKLLRGLSGRPDLEMAVVCAQLQAGAARERMAHGSRISEALTLGVFARTPIALGLNRKIKQANPSIIHYHAPYPWAEFHQVLFGPRVPYVVHYHSDIVSQKRLLTLYAPFLRRFLQEAATIITATQNMKRNSPFLRDYQDKIQVIPYGLDLECYEGGVRTEARAAELRAQFAPGGEKVLLFVGRLVPYKGLAYLLAAMPEIDAKLVIVGEGPLEPSLKEMTAELGIASKVRFWGSATEEDLPAMYRSADLFVLPSHLNSEAFGLVQIEAHASGLPVVSCNLSTGVSEANLDGQTGFCVRPADPAALAEGINTLLRQDELRISMGAFAQERAFREFQTATMCDRIHDLYRRLG